MDKVFRSVISEMDSVEVVLGFRNWRCVLFWEDNGDDFEGVDSKRIAIFEKLSLNWVWVMNLWP